ncbi:uncharacterized protein [Drosophila tropicalis]|uniref:uncharacterized protein n=1 Tax=Drosophila tropicalis TaxID=46794 RepID=UPI0035AC11D7
MSQSFKIGSMQACLRSCMKRCHPIHKVATPRECPPGPLQRLLARKRSSLSMMRTNRSNRDIRQRNLNYSTRTFSNCSSEGGGVKDEDKGKFKLVNFEPIMRKGDYWQVLVTLKKTNPDGPRDRWLRHVKHRENSRRLGVTNVISAIRLGNFYKDSSLPQKMKRLDVPKLVRFVKTSQKRLDTLKIEPKVLNNSHKVIESVNNLLAVATKKVLMRHDRVDRRRFIGKHIEVPKALREQHKEIETIQLPDDLLSKLRKKIKVNSKNQNTEPLTHLKDCDLRLKTLRNKIQNNPLTRGIPLTASSECHAKESEIVPRQYQWLLGSIRKSSSNIKRYPKMHIKIRGSINIKRNSLGQLKGTSQTKVFTTIPKNGESIL